ncbi:MAG: substrate-binding domain-containing protein [Spirochaetales bacterium]|nr:substrate-binding domain-containing protein [Spirochaetales bacterium]
MAVKNERKIKTIALIIDALSGMGSYQEDILNGVSQAVKDVGANFLVFPGGSIGARPSNKFEYNRNIVYELINSDTIDGIILAGGTIGNYISHDQFLRFLRKYTGIPMVSISGGLEGIPNVMIDNQGGFEKIFEHLIVEHKYKKIVFISGPEANEDAQERYVVYKKMLAKYNISFDERLVFIGNFMEPSGHEAIEVLLDERNVAFDVVVAANDNMAIGALKELELRGHNVPSDVAVVGFDDVVEASIVTPPLTTVRQPVHLQAEKAVEIILQMIDGKYPEQEMQYIDTEFIIRKSCGCVTAAKKENGEELPEVISNSREDWLESVSNLITQYCTDDTENLVIKRLFLSFLDELQGKQQDVFLQEWEEFLDTHLSQTEDLLIINKCLTTFREAALSLAKGQEIVAENLIYQAHNVMMQIVHRMEIKKRARAEGLSQQVSEIGMILGVSFDINELSEGIAKVMPTLKIDNFIFGMYKNPLKPLEAVSIICRYRDGEIVTLPDEGLELPAYNVLSMDFLKNKGPVNYVVYPLYFKEEQLGLFLMELAPEYGFVYETIYNQICTSIEGALLVERNIQVRMVIEKHSREIENLTLPMLESIKDISEIAVDKMKVVNELADQTRQSWEKLSETNKNIEKIASNINKLLDIIKIIEDIADKVNLLALNTSIEAVHVGQYGVGFSVIAKEIKKLSETTRTHSNEIAYTLKEIVKYAQDTSRYGQESINTFQHQQQGVKDILTSFETISQKMQELGHSSTTILDMIKKK